MREAGRGIITFHAAFWTAPCRALLTWCSVMPRACVGAEVCKGGEVKECGGVG